MLKDKAMTKERIFFRGVSEIVGSENLGLLILTDESQMRQISIVCDRAMALLIELRAKRVAITDTMLPEVLYRLLRNNTVLNLEMVITGITDGQYTTFLYDTAAASEISLIRASDAVLLSMISDIPLYMESALFLRQSVPYNISSKGVSLPVNSLSDEMLQSALDKAISEENYELASYLRDEKIRRTRNGGNHSNDK